MLALKAKMSAGMERHMVKFVRGYMEEVVCVLSKKYGFDAREALSHVGELELSREGRRKEVGKSKTKGPSVPLPYCGEHEGWCNGIRLSHSLYSQCTQAPKVEGEYCGTCQAQADKNNGIPTYGNIKNRGTLDWRDKKGKKPTNYGNVMLKLNINRKQAEEEAEKFGLTIPEEQFEVLETKKGRPSKKKNATASDTESEGETKKRGRPKKVKKVVSGSGDGGDDLIAKLLQQASLDGQDVVAEPKKVSPVAEAPNTNAEAPEKTDAEEEKRVARNEKARQKRAEKKALQSAAHTQLVVELKNKGGAEEEKSNLTKAILEEINEVFDEELKVSPTSLSGCSDGTPEVKVTKFEFEGKTYLKDEDDCLFDAESQDHIGNWNEANKCIDYCDEEE